MARKLKESDFAKWCLQIAFALFLLAVTLIALSQVLFSILSNIASLDERPVWIGFWGNIIGGLLGLAGGLVAAYAAVRTVERQLKHSSEERKAEAQKQITSYVKIFFMSLAGTVEAAKLLIAALDKDDLYLSIERGGNVFLFERMIGDSMRAEWQNRVPTVANHLMLFLGFLDNHKQALHEARQFYDSGEVKSVSVDRRTAGHIQRIASATCVLLMQGSILCSAMADEINEQRSEMTSHALALAEVGLKLQKHSSRLYDNYVRLGGNPNSLAI